jgi:hypothetical protein
VVAALQKTKLPSPQDVNFEATIEPRVLDNANSFLRVLTSNVLPRYELHTIVPWLRLQTPWLVDTDSDFVIITGEATTIAPVGDCNSQQLPVSHDPTFPSEHVPSPSLPDAEIDFAVYARHQVFSDFFSAMIAKPVGFSDSIGSIRRLELTGDVRAASANKPLVLVQTNQGPIGTLVMNAFESLLYSQIDIVVEGVCSTHRTNNVDGLTGSAKLAGQINFSAVINSKFVGSVNGHLQFTNKQVFTTALSNGDPFVIAMLSSKIDAEVDKGFDVLMGEKDRVCNWTMFEMPPSYLQTIPTGMYPMAHAEGLADVSGLVAMIRQKG